MRYRSRSFWLDTLPGDLTPRPALDRDLDVDVAIVGAGYTGSVDRVRAGPADPTLRIAVLEAEIAGFGASGRNGGWCSALFAGSREATGRAPRPRRRGRAAAGDCSPPSTRSGGSPRPRGSTRTSTRAGRSTLATAPDPGASPAGAGSSTSGRWGFGRGRRARGSPPTEARGAPRRRRRPAERSSRPHCARDPPARAWRAGSRDAAERRGVTDLRAAPACARDRSPRRVETPGGRRDAPTSSCARPRATPPACRDQRRTLAPLYSLMIATEPLPAGVLGRGRLGASARPSPTAATSSSTGSAPPTTASPSAVAARRTTSAVAVRDGFDRDPATFAELQPVLEGALPGARRTRRSRTSGADRSASPATGTARSASTGRRGSRGPAATSATAWARATSPAARSPTSSSAATPTSPRLPWVDHRSPRVGAGAAALARHQRRAAPHRRPRPDRGPHRTPVTLARAALLGHGLGGSRTAPGVTGRAGRQASRAAASNSMRAKWQQPAVRVPHERLAVRVVRQPPGAPASVNTSPPPGPAIAAADASIGLAAVGRARADRAARTGRMPSA